MNNITSEQNIKSCILIKTNGIYSYKDNINEIKNDLTTKLITKAIKSKQIIFQKKVDNFTYKYINYSASVNIAKPGIKFTTVFNEKFKIDNELFSEEEVIESLKSTFPERFI